MARRSRPAAAELGASSVEVDWLEATAVAAAGDADAPPELLGEYLTLLADAAIRGDRPTREQLAGIGAYGRRAAQDGIAPGRAVNLYLSAAWRLWRGLPGVV